MMQHRAHPLKHDGDVDFRGDALAEAVVIQVV